MWQPSDGDLKGILELLNLSQSPDNNVQKQVFQQLNQLEQNPQFSLYLSFILCRCTNEQVGPMIRWRAGTLLKTTLGKVEKRVFQSLTPQYRNYIMQNAIGMLGDENKNIRRVSSSIVTTALNTEQNNPLRLWPNLVSQLATMTVQGSPAAVEGSFYCLSLVCEDSARDLHEDERRPLDELFPHFVGHMGHQTPMIRRLALTCVVHVLPFQPNVLDQHMQNLLQALSNLTKDPESETRQLVCKALCRLLEIRFDQLLPMMPQVIEFMLTAMQDDDDTVAMEACEFWAVYCEEGSDALDLLKQYLPRLIPLLMQKMVYGDDELLDLDAEDEANANVKDRAEDIRPVQHKSQVHGAGGDDDDGDDDDEEEASGFTLRKAAAGSMDLLAMMLGEEILPVYLPCFKQCTFQIVQNPDHWLRLEAGIMSLGAVADGVGVQLKPYLDEIFPLLIQACSHTRPLIRSIALWTISKYAKWVCWTSMKPERGGAAARLEPCLSAMLERMKDHNKTVQGDAVSALCRFMETAEGIMKPYAGHVIPVFVHCHTYYQERNMYLLYDAIGALATAVGTELQRPEYMQQILPPLIKRWNALDDMDRNLLPVLETIAAVASSLGVQFLQFATGIYERCLTLIETALSVMLANIDDEVDTDFLVCALDLLAGIAEGLGVHFAQLVQSGNLLDLIPHCAAIHINDARQSTYALVGEMSSKGCIQLIGPILPKLIGQMIQDIRYDQDTGSEEDEWSGQNDCCNNAIWCLGEIAKAAGGQNMQPFVDQVVNKVGRAVMDQWCPGEVRVNGVVTLSRFALACPSKVSQLISFSMSNYCLKMVEVQQDAEKTDAYKGLVVLLQANPQLGIQNFRFVVHALLKGVDRGLSGELSQALVQFVFHVKQTQGANWNAFVSSCGLQGNMQQKLAALCAGQQ